MARNRRSPGGLSSLEFAFLRVWEIKYGMKYRPVMQLRFALPDRQWRFDFAWPNRRVAVEVDGGIFIRGRHNRGIQFTQDCEKINAAVMRGWRVLRYTTKDLEKRPVQVAEEVMALLNKSAAWREEQKGLALHA